MDSPEYPPSRISAHSPSTASSLALILFAYASLAAGKLLASLVLTALPPVAAPSSLANACNGEKTSWKRKGRMDRTEGEGGVIQSFFIFGRPYVLHWMGADM